MAAFAIAACAAVSPVPIAAQAASPAIQQKLNRVGADLFSTAPHADEAIKELKAILAAEPALAEAHMLLGIAYRVQGSPDLMGEAVAELRQALALNASLTLARLTLARLYMDTGRAARARDELDVARGQAPDHPQVLALLGEAERQLGNPKRSVELNKRALQADSTFVQARYYLGLALIDLRQYAQAIAEMQAVVQAGDHQSEAYAGLGSAYLNAGRASDAVRALREAVRLDPSRPETRVQLARAYRVKGQLTDALEQLKLARPSGPAGLSTLYHDVELDSYMEEGLVRLQQGRLEAAAELFQRVLDLDARHEPAQRKLGEVRKRLEERARGKAPGAPK
jgi:tetratricopeptide (TPR) repeat protein